MPSTSADRVAAAAGTLARAGLRAGAAACLAGWLAIGAAWAQGPASGASDAASGAGRATSVEPPAVPAPSAPAASAAASGVAEATVRSTAIERGVQALRNDPLLSGKHRTHTLNWTFDTDAKPPDEPEQSWLQWIAAFARFVNDASRFLVYGIALVSIALLLVSLRHLFQLREFRRRAKAAAAVSHVRDLDVRPESLPDDVGAAAWALWQADEVKAALSLLYRGALSRLIHRHGVPIEASTTEGECLALARGRVDPSAHRYLTQVVRAREAHIYGNRTLSLAMGQALCSGFASRLDPPAAAPVEGDASPAGAVR
jgi:hypothetical protein